MGSGWALATLCVAGLGFGAAVALLRWAAVARWTMPSRLALIPLGCVLVGAVLLACALVL